LPGGGGSRPSSRRSFGPRSVEACDCVPAYPETQAYVTRIIGLLGGAGAIAMPEFEVRLVA
jgi:hypothetical protein